ncbi:xanthine dehydrogenase family protein molybdopterin-binding subunit [Sulfuracidifex tepidarius]|uniref:Glyceraldehyde dehydrogenase large chain n=1 Tax=Sulfuracidifex tepidarius TaxID=1294262 RepID=A0A510E2B8_9CREN|nr:xanthine dehydrogenase family protein molybdopterin-binding subunit [Sulfuracidifex tepidarius]BBG26218.1 Glyceraldehyde dehydrogenase large chain [Sulfuracidifex tepidarius]
MLKESYDVITGKSVYIDDLHFDDEVYLYVVRSNYARAKIKRVTSPSRSLLFMTGKEFHAEMPAVSFPESRIARMPVLPEEDVNFFGQPVAALVTEERYDIEDLADEVNVDYEPMTPITRISESLKDEEIIHPNLHTNVSTDSQVEGGNLSLKEKADVYVEREIEQGRVISNPMEPKGVIALFRGGSLTLYGSLQAPFRVRNDIHEVLGLSPEKINVIAPKNVGGGFGNKVPGYPEYVLASLAAMKLNKPVKWIETRREHLTNPTQGRGVHGKVRLYADKTGRALGVEGEVIVDLGAYNYTINAITPTFIARLLTGPYKMEFVSVRARGVFTNLPPTGPYRGAGRPEATLFHETLMEDLAKELKMDPVDLREKNLIDGEYVTPSGLRIDNGGYREVFNKAKEIYRSIKERGKSLIVFAEQVSIPPGESARVTVGNGKVKVIVPSGPHGQAHRSTFAKIASQVLGVSQDVIEVITGTTEGVKEGVGSFGSRTASVAGSAVTVASKSVLESLKSRGVTIEEALNSQDEVSVEVFFKGDVIFSAGAHVAVVGLDGYFPRVKEYYAFDDVGKALIEEEVEGQIIGGVLQGVSQVLWEEAKYDENGMPLIGSIADEGVPSAVEASYKVIPGVVEFPSSLPDGARGVGEAGTTGSVAAVVIALEKLLGKKVTKTPIDPDFALS